MPSLSWPSPDRVTRMPRLAIPPGGNVARSSPCTDGRRFAVYGMQRQYPYRHAGTTALQRRSVVALAATFAAGRFAPAIRMPVRRVHRPDGRSKLSPFAEPIHADSGAAVARRYEKPHPSAIRVSRQHPRLTAARAAARNGSNPLIRELMKIFMSSKRLSPRQPEESLSGLRLRGGLRTWGAVRVSKKAPRIG
jgi:hypothetical protein